MLEPDHLIALQLQEQFEQEAEVEAGSNLVYKKNNNPNLNNSKSLIDPSWELIDPTPDIYTLFMVFNERYFWGKLVTVCVSWSKRMTTCAGICSYQGRGGMCKITLSEPLLKLRPRKDLVETLLHEMIHAYLFVTNNNRDRDGHGPEFHKHMYRINAEAGTSISVYHDFHDEVRLYQQHWWRCNGICQKWKPYFGIVRRATNRAPGANDYWWLEHSKNCGGTFIKVKEPENFKGRKTQKENVKPTANPKNDIRRYIGNSQISKSDSTFHIKNGSNIVGFKDIQKGSVGIAIKNSSSTIVVTNKTNSNQYANNNKDVNKQKTEDYSIVRNHWLQKFQNQTEPKKDSKVNDKKRTLSLNVPVEEKRQKIISPSLSMLDMPISNINTTDFVKCPVCLKNIESNGINQHLDSCLTKTSENKTEVQDLCLICNETVSKDALNSHVNDCLDRISINGKIKCDLCGILIDRDKFSNHHKECLDNVFVDNPNMEKRTCNICGKDVAKINFDQHLERCLHDIYDASEPANVDQIDRNNVKENTSNNNCDTQDDDLEKSNKSENDNEKVSCLVCGKSVIKSNLGVHLDECMDSIFNKKDKSNVDEENECSSADQKFNCPFCLKYVLESEMTNHLNLCFSV
ncbi:sprT-like domain-containing protein Spartan isoform X2 [Agrilus planipennis]|uniref:Protein with SprT-like domain at the N terminus n=1 Tax=Agrilus planipennis TaxID=224129 RepID=A0A1W4XI46_AGRPL|nr:sprT-like domain-containing protein Spartan isoform X2 [Agrilus planipennis]